MKCMKYAVVYILLLAGELLSQNPKYTTKYDGYFSKYCKRYFSVGFDWHWFKAQAIAESDLNKDAESWCKAKGIMQLLPSTFAELCERYPELKKNIRDPRWNIAAGIRYDRDLWIQWKAERPFQDRLHFTFGSYNAGLGTLLKAQEMCMVQNLNENLWQSIERVAPTVEVWRHDETINYIKRINKVYSEISSSP